MTINIPILYEDQTLLVVNKPPGLVVNNAQSVKGETLQDWAAEKIHSSHMTVYREVDKVFIERAGIVHRIDKETSGILIIAKTPSAFSEMQRQFQERIIKKTYLAIVHGSVVPGDGEIRAPVGRLPWNRERFGILPGGKEAVTRYKVQRAGVIVHGVIVSLVELYPETGRTHQIRVHLKYINHPVIGDWQYAGRKTARADRIWAPRVMLHAWKVSFTHPETGLAVAIEAPVPDDMSSIIN